MTQINFLMLADKLELIYRSFPHHQRLDFMLTEAAQVLYKYSGTAHGLQKALHLKLSVESVRSNNTIVISNEWT